jgi:2'-5' RNA ligase
MQPLRLFIALELPPDLQQLLLSSFKKLPLHPNLYRLTPREQLHLTVKFLGDTPVTDLPALTSVLDSFDGEPAPTIRVERGMLLPPGRPRAAVISAIPDPSLLDLQARIDALLSEEGLSQPERRRFRPHITVARLKEAAQPEDQQILAAWSPTSDSYPLLTMTLFQSELLPTGPRYTPLEQIVLS